ncbi:MAG: hypothetical protein DRG24_00840 [Epsilonproteobacteria bacterium]|nr:MAG: hypothetical protein DRG24_00840 [Campylobacterota bacterium]
MQSIEGKACFNHMKLQTGDIVFFDDSKRYNFMSSSRTKLLDISIKKSSTSILYHRISNALNRYISDTEQRLQNLITGILYEYSDMENLSHETALILEQNIINTILNLLEEQQPTQRLLTKGEQTVATIRDQVIHHMDVIVSVESLAAEYDVTTKTLQNGCKSLFGFTPIRFLRLLKLNLVRNDLIEGSPQTHTVLRVAQKWGFTHMGRFSSYYKELFLENPSDTLKSVLNDEGINENCVIRQEEID